MASKHAAKNRRREAERARLDAAVERQAALPARELRPARERYQPRNYGRPGSMAATNTLLALLAGAHYGQQLDHDAEVRAEALARLRNNDYAK